ncbi:hypothetical protein N7520_004232 [Penicillium odoratum]|uniref:uncharacterized protein n=1 Tax=Penicillium odoratum TaxID=1167516 RepID=UPI0025493DFA|nr:uncharacterized protein N7520_004232 [Penicillium odoratum]KAJ5769673.1 hypothetical protein N7520_004232 [Penicillium odoratum]
MFEDDPYRLKVQVLCHAMTVICNDLGEVTLNFSLSLDSIPPSVISAIYYAALGQKLIPEAEFSAIEDREDSIFIKSLRAISARWMLAKRYLEML